MSDDTRKGKSRTTIRRHLKELRAECIDSTDDPVLSRIAYAMETAVTWATTRAVGWASLREEAQIMAQLLRQDLERRR